MNLKWGLYLHNELIKEYSSTEIGYEEAMKDAEFAYQETGIPHLVKRVTE